MEKIKIETIDDVQKIEIECTNFVFAMDDKDVVSLGHGSPESLAKMFAIAMLDHEDLFVIMKNAVRVAAEVMIKPTGEGGQA